jgi:uncharacterized 2Fe-2S/4Fe-4S cluster protein (DUF4445 family)
MKTITITFQPIGKEIKVNEGISIFRAALENGIEITSICGGEKLCGKCIIKITEGLKPPTPLEKKFFSDKELVDGFRLACKTFISDDTTVWLVNQKEVESIKILTTGVELPVEINNDLQILTPEIKEPSLDNQLALVDSLKDAVKQITGLDKESIQIPMLLHNNLSDITEKTGYKIQIIMNGDEISNITPQTEKKGKYGIAVDLGTTTIVGLLIDLESGKTLSVASATNPQISVGADVITRVNYTINHEHGLKKLHDLVINSINDIIKEVCSDINIIPDDIYQFALAGNSIMNHIFLNINPKKIALSPYLPVFKNIEAIKAPEIGLKINPHGKVFILPNISGYVGGDITGLIISQNLLHTDKITLALDLGTNGEIVLGSKKKLLCCATAAGPAFEGGHISSGMRAAKGAIDKVSIYENIPHYHTINNEEPVGICGTGLLDLVAELLDHEVIDETGRILGIDELSEKGLLLKQYIKSEDAKNEFMIYSENGNSISLRQQDVRELQLAKGAVKAGISTLIASLGIKDEDIDQILIAGAFGSFINKESAMRIGLIPKIDINKVKSIGNSASIGAKQYLLSINKRKEAEESIYKTEYIELCNIPAFQDRFMEEMMF